jgi:1-acyl-sn-glycerol-3-phosphate acyltransferase
MGSWHLFNMGWWQKALIRRGGVFSVYREGMDRAAVTTAIDVLTAARRPLVVFPEGVVSRTNERLNPLMEGVALIARGAARRRAKLSPPREVVVHPVGLRYFFMGNVDQAVAPTLAEIEHRLSWQVQSHLPLAARVARLGLALLSLKEVEYFGAPQSGTVAQRLSALIDHLLAPLEKEWLPGRTSGGQNVVARVKRLRAAILPDMVAREVDEAERQRRWRQLADCYLAQQLSFYPPDYLRDQPSAERLLETVERYEEDLTDDCRPYSPMVAVARVGPAIAVSPERQRGGDDPLLAAIDEQLRGMIASIERPERC